MSKSSNQPAKNPKVSKKNGGFSDSEAILSSFISVGKKSPDLLTDSRTFYQYFLECDSIGILPNYKFDQNGGHRVGYDNALYDSFPKTIPSGRIFYRGKLCSITAVKPQRLVTNSSIYKICGRNYKYCEYKIYTDVLIDSLFATILFFHSQGWSGIDLSQDNILIERSTHKFFVKRLEGLRPNNIISNGDSFKFLKEDYMSLLKLIETIGYSKDKTTVKQKIVAIEKIVGAIQTEFIDAVYCASDSMGPSSNRALSAFFKCTRVFSPKLVRKHHDIKIGDSQFTLIKGYSGVGKSSFLNSFLQSEILNQRNTFVIRSNTTRKISVLDDFVFSINGWLEYLISHDNKIKILIENFSENNGSALSNVFAPIAGLCGKTLDVTLMPPSENEIMKFYQRIETKIFKHQFLALLQKVASAFDDTLYILFDNFNSADRVTIDFLDFFLKNNTSKNIKILIFYREYEPEAQHNSLEVIRTIEHTAVSLQKVLLQPFDLTDVRLFNKISLGNQQNYGRQLSDEKLLSITKGNPLFIKALNLGSDLGWISPDTSFEQVFFSLIKKKSMQVDFLKVLNILTMFGKDTKISVLQKLSNLGDLNGFQMTVMRFVSTGILKSTGQSLWFSHDKFADLLLNRMDPAERKAINYMIANYLLENEYSDQANDDLIFDIACHAARSKSLIETVHESSVFASICFAASVISRDFGALDEAYEFASCAEDLVEKCKLNGGSHDGNFEFVLGFELGCLCIEKKDLLKAVVRFQDLLQKTTTPRERLEVEYELAKLYAKNRSTKEFTSLVGDVLSRYSLPNIDHAESISLQAVVSNINRNLLGVRIDDVKNIRICNDANEAIFQLLLNQVLKYFLYMDHQVALWAGLQIMDRSLKYGQTSVAPIGVVCFAYYQTNVLGDKIGGELFAKLAVQMKDDRPSQHRDWFDGLSAVLNLPRRSNTNLYQEELRRLLNKAIKSHNHEGFGFLAISSILNEIFIPNTPSFLKDRLYILNEIARSSDFEAERFVSFSDEISFAIDGLTVKGNIQKYSIIRQNHASRIEMFQNPYLRNLSILFQKQMQFMLDYEIEEDCPAFNSSSSEGGSLFNVEI